MDIKRAIRHLLGSPVARVITNTGHTTMNISPVLYFVSAALSHKTMPVNLRRHTALDGALAFVPHRAVRGCYEGTMEDSYCIAQTNNFGLNEAKFAGSLFGQHSILEVDGNRECTLHYEDGTQKHVGSFASQWDKPVNQDYTLDGDTGLYWVIV